ncbi:MAG: D-glycerate dehydrogenase [Anaerolineae bacterium]|nr:D-glycerate dehydrogenase [Anaerolineae bacterium]
MPLPRVLITNTVPDTVLEPLNGLAQVILGPDHGLMTPREEILTMAPQLAGIINQGELRVDAELLDHAPNLRIVANVAAGYNNLDVALMERRGVWATNTPDTFYEATADFTLALILAVARFVVKGDRFVREGQWKRFEPGIWDGTLLMGKTLGIVGYGRTGQAVARRARAFGMNIRYTRRQVVQDAEYCDLDPLLRESDFVSLHVPLTEETRHLVDADRLALMKPNAYLINMARGPVVDEAALVEALQNHCLAGAGLDVFENEPAIHPALLTMDNVILAPHVGGGTHESRFQARHLCARNVAAVLRGERPLTPINEPELTR